MRSSIFFLSKRPLSDLALHEDTKIRQ
uniref:Uncharacterized protein n=1 Tax=Anguilla anguilla TaxID=7936 RepID=A0A0E9P7E9_ANGAN